MGVEVDINQIAKGDLLITEEDLNARLGNYLEMNTPLPCKI